ncbi:phenylalanyl-tRNA synthetase mitochondrial precursor [Globomyces pollinis-pini]|nr:phenylalanyl-tRNA synthetase mitochondrial precursor [Globomyces pollinis-pini]
MMRKLYGNIQSLLCNSNYRFYSIAKYPADYMTNITPSILSKLDLKLHLTPNHPIHILKSLIDAHLSTNHNYTILDKMNPIVSTKQNFDDLLFDSAHPGRSKTDTYYVNEHHVLRTHTSAHQSEALASDKASGYLLSADVYRRDEIDPTHYPVFHQMEGIRLFNSKDLSLLQSDPQINAHVLEPLDFETDNPVQKHHSVEHSTLVAKHLRLELEGLIKFLFNDEHLQIRWIQAYFPFTSPSWEMEIFYNNQWLEVLGCGVIEQEIINNALPEKSKDIIGWAFGIGLERIAMVLFDIPDIRLFWSTDPRFLSQFKSGKITKFVPFSKYPVCYKDISFWYPTTFHENDMSEIVRTICGDTAEEGNLPLIDTFVHPKTKKQSRCYRINYRSMDRTLTNKEIDQLHNQLAAQLVEQLGIELR